jgi:3-phosphoshikimate 1-carboxyvinyltransferase
MKSIELIPKSESVIGTVEIPGSKSYTNRALIMASLTQGETRIVNPLISDDTDAMINCLKEFGIKIRKLGNSFIVENDVSELKDGNYELNANLSGTTIRFILALSCIIPGTKRISGGDGLHKRPIGDLVNALRQLGATIEYENKVGFPPLVVKSQQLSSHLVKLNGTISSQYLSAILMIAPLINGLTIEVTGNQISKSYIDITVSMMNDWGIKVSNLNYSKYIIGADQEYAMNEYRVEGDYSAAGYFAAIAVLTNSTITLKNIKAESVQGDKEFIKILENMGNIIIFDQNQITIIGKVIKPVEANMEQCPDQAQTLAVLSSFAKGTTTLTGVRSLRVKETERVKALQNELEKMNIKTESPDEDTLIIYGGNPRSAEIDTYGDHRMAMSFAVAGTKLKGMKINNPEVVNKTFPDFWNELIKIGVIIK